MKRILLQGLIASCLCLPLIAQASDQEQADTWAPVSGFWVDHKARLCWSSCDGSTVSTYFWYIDAKKRLCFSSGPSSTTKMYGNWEELKKRADSIRNRKQSEQ